jgi:hypothetical protein
VELGALTLGETPRIALELESLALPGAHWIRSEIELDRDAHASLEGTASAVLFGGDRLEIGVLLAPARQGRFAADLTVRALRGRAGTLVEGAPVRVHVRATVHAREVERVAGPSVGLGLARGLGLGAGAVLLFVSIAAWRARRAR